MKIGINGFGRMGRLALRAGWARDDVEFVAVNEPCGDAATMAHLLEFDSVQRRFDESCSGQGDVLRVGDRALAYTRTEDVPRWRDLGVDLVLECSGRRRKPELVQPHLEAGARRVVVSAPVTGDVPNIVVGVNEDAFDLATAPIVSAASCTTNCLAPVVRVLHDGLGIERGLVTTIHDPTNTQTVHDGAVGRGDDARRARAAQLSLIPTSTNSATAVTRILPELEGRLDAIAVRAPVLNASITDAVFHVARETTVDEVNGLIEAAALEGRLAGILGFERRPLVSVDYAGDPRSAIVDAASTRVTDGRLVKVLAWYDNEWGYANRMVELAGLVARAAEGRR